MKSKLELQEDKTFKLKSMEEIVSTAKHEQRAMNKDESARFDNLKKDADFIDGQLDSIKELEERESYISTEMAKSRVPESRKVSPAQPSNEPSVSVNENRIVSASWSPNKMRAFDDTVEGRKHAYTAGKWFAAINGNASAQRYCHENGIELRTNLNEGTTTAGQYTVPTVVEAAITKIRNEVGIMPGQVRIRTMPNYTLNIPTQTANISAVVVAEGNAPSTSQQVFGQCSLVAQKAIAVTQYSSELSEDSLVNIGDEVAREHGYAFGYFFDDAFWNGTASGNYGAIDGVGHVLSASHAASVQAAASTHTTFATITQTDIQTAMGLLPAYAWRNAKIFCSRYVYVNVFLRLAAAAGGNSILSLSQQLSGPNWLGTPIVMCEALPGASAASTTSQPVFYFGDPNQGMAVGERRGLTTGVSTDYGFTSDLVTVRTTQRIAMKALNLGTNSVTGSFVTLTTAAS